MAGQNGPCKEEQTELLAAREIASSNTEAVTLPVIGVLEAASPRPSKLSAGLLSVPVPVEAHLD